MSPRHNDDLQRNAEDLGTTALAVRSSAIIRRATTVDDIVDDIYSPERTTPPTRRASRQSHHHQPGTGTMDVDTYDRRQRRPRPTTDSDPELKALPARPTAAKPAAPVSRRTVLQYGFGAFGGVLGLAVARFGIAEYMHLEHRIEEGVVARSSTTLVCGHNHDSLAHPTQLDFELQKDGSLVFREIPAGDQQKKHEFLLTLTAQKIDMQKQDTVYLTIEPHEMQPGRFQIELGLQIDDPWVLIEPASSHWLMIDRGGYFGYPA